MIVSRIVNLGFKNCNKSVSHDKSKNYLLIKIIPIGKNSLQRISSKYMELNLFPQNNPPYFSHHIHSSKETHRQNKMPEYYEVWYDSRYYEVNSSVFQHLQFQNVMSHYRTFYPVVAIHFSFFFWLLRSSVSTFG